MFLIHKIGKEKQIPLKFHHAVGIWLQAMGMRETEMMLLPLQISLENVPLHLGLSCERCVELGRGDILALRLHHVQVSWQWNC